MVGARSLYVSPSVFRAKFTYETLVHANRFLMPIEFPLSCVDPCTAVPALAILHSTRFQEFNVTSTFSQVLFETADKVMPDRHAEILSIGVDCAPPDYPRLRSIRLHEFKRLLTERKELA
jgi:hypothetical protein